jgi:glutamyl-Q tRNA(Asp) synthetase
LHFGSLVAALASFADARHHHGEWLVRIEDLDPQRTIPGAAQELLDTLRALGFRWDGPVLYQSARTSAYAAALDRLIGAELAFPCACTRKEIATAGHHGVEGPIYPGTCRNGLPPGRTARAWRFRAPREPVRFSDRIAGDRAQDIAAAVGDFIVRRADAVHAYQLAVVVDDAAQGITHIVRGADLLDSTPRQISLQRALGLPTPAYAHVPLVLDAAGRKLSKSDAAMPLHRQDPIAALDKAWRFLGQEPIRISTADPCAFLARAVDHWDPARVAARPCRAPIENGDSSVSPRAD